MSTDAQVIRSERHEEIGALIQRDKSILVENWCRRAIEEQPNAKRVHHAVLRDRLAIFLDALGQGLSESDNGDVSPHRIPAVEHGEQRWEAGWSLPEVVRDYQILRLVILDHLENTLHRPLHYREMMAIGLALDEAITASVGMYVANREAYILQIEHQRVEALQLADQRKDEFLAILGHELRNPLASVLNSVSILRLSAPDNPQIGQASIIVERQIRQMVRLIDDLLDATRISQGKLEVHRQPVKLSSAVDQAVQTVTSLIDSRRHELTVALPNESPWVTADPGRLVQVLVNLLTNAAKYTDPGGKISLSAERSGEHVVVRVRDTGIGIAPEMLAHVFELFTQLDSTQDRSGGGLGIGLTLVRRLVELQGGQVSASSAGPGKGSEFVVTLPAYTEATPPATSVGAPGLAAASGRHLLIVEDDADARDTLRKLLQLAGHRVEVAQDGPTAIELALRARPEVALVDIGLEEMDGYEVARHLRKELGQATFLVALTGFSNTEDRRLALGAGFDAYLTKPVDLEELSRLLTRSPLSPAGPE